MYIILQSLGTYSDMWICKFTLLERQLHVHLLAIVPSNQSFYRQIAGYQRGVGDHRVD